MTMRPKVVNIGWMGSLPNTVEYIKKYGTNLGDGNYEAVLASAAEAGPRFNRLPELLYGECLKTNKQWFEIVNPIRSGGIIL